MTDYTISPRSRNLGLGWSNTPVQRYNSRGQGSLVIQQAAAPDATGGLRSVEQELTRAAKLNSGNDWASRLFVAGEPVRSYWTYLCDWNEDNQPTNERMGWALVQGTHTIREILRDLRDGNEVRVRTEASHGA